MLSVYPAKCSSSMKHIHYVIISNISFITKLMIIKTCNIFATLAWLIYMQNRPASKNSAGLVPFDVSPCACFEHSELPLSVVALFGLSAPCIQMSADEFIEMRDILFFQARSLLAPVNAPN